MRPSCQLALAGLLVFSLIPSQLCQMHALTQVKKKMEEKTTESRKQTGLQAGTWKVCIAVNETNFWHIEPLINTMLNAKYTERFQDANVLLTFRLVGIKSQRLEQQLSGQIKEDINSREMELTSGELALDILALGACENQDREFIRGAHLVSKLGVKFQAEIQNMEAHGGNPLTNYYQLSLALLALCLFNGHYSITSVTYYFTPENKNYYFEDQFSVDTGAMAVLALTCVRRDTQRKMGASTQRKISGYIASLANKIQAEGKQGLLGNVFSTGEAMQALFVSSDYYKNERNCRETLRTVFDNISQGVFYLPIAAAQILPALMGKTYLDVISPSCGHNPVKFNVSTEKPDMATPTTAPLNILVKYSVRINTTSHTQVTVRKGSVFLDVMKAAQEKNEALFRFTVEETSWGPFVTSVQGISASSKDRTYWKLLSNGQPLTQGAGSHVVQNGDNLEQPPCFTVRG
uniref:Transcobalamin 1 n=1 Tax=Ovis aries TaxID=9940 RepID=A0AC11D8V1_SHEEP